MSHAGQLSINKDMDRNNLEKNNKTNRYTTRMTDRQEYERKSEI